MPLSVDEVEQLYAFNLVLTDEDVAELAQTLPYLGDVLDPEQFRAFVRGKMSIVRRTGNDHVAADKGDEGTAERTVAAVADLCGTSSAKVVFNLRKAVCELSPEAYEAAYRRLAELSGKRWAYRRRATLLARLAQAAPDWAAAIAGRKGVHAGGSAPGDALAAWDWRQAQQG